MHSSAADVTSTWDDSTGDWSDDARWDSTDFPNNGNGGFTYDAIINGGSVTLDQDIAIELLDFNNGTINGAFDLVVDTLDWSAGNLSGSGGITTSGGSWSGAAGKTLSRTMTIDGAFGWSDGDVFGSGEIVVLSGSSFNLVGPGNRSLNNSGGLTIDAGGTLTKTGAVTRSIIGPFTNNRLVVCQH